MAGEDNQDRTSGSGAPCGETRRSWVQIPPVPHTDGAESASNLGSLNTAFVSRVQVPLTFSEAEFYRLRGSWLKLTSLALERSSRPMQDALVSWNKIAQKLNRNHRLWIRAYAGRFLTTRIR